MSQSCDQSLAADSGAAALGHGERRRRTDATTNLPAWALTWSQDGPRWFLLAILVYAPWAFGATRPATITFLSILLSSCLCFWLLSAVFLRSWPKVPRLLLAVALILVAQGWWMAFNSAYDFNPKTWEFTERPRLSAYAPGGLDFQLCLTSAWRATTLLGTLLLVCQIAADRVWLKRLLWTIGLCGLSIVAFGLFQRLAGAPSIFWEARDTGKTFFATYRYHSNAGSFINLIWPAVAALCVREFRGSHRILGRLGWAAALGLCLTGLVVSGARAAALVAIPVIALWAGWIALQMRRGHLAQFDRSTLAVAGVLLLLLIVATAFMAGMDISFHRWNKFEEMFSAQNPRLLVDGVCLRMIPQAGWWGFGPGTFHIAFPFHTGYLGEAVSGVWIHAHQDYLQTLIEWGYLGALGWGVCILGGLWRAWRCRLASFTDRTIRWACFTGVMATLLHALVDFPLQIASLQLYFIVLLGILWGLASHPNADGSKAQRRAT